MLLLFALGAPGDTAAQVIGRSTFASGGGDYAAGPYQVQATVAVGMGAGIVGGGNYSARAGWKASVLNPPELGFGETTLGAPTNGAYQISHQQLLQATGTRDVDGDSISFLISATGGVLATNGTPASLVLIHAGQSLTWTPGATRSQLIVIADDGILLSAPFSLNNGVVPPTITGEPGDLRVRKGLPALLTAAVTGTGPLVYQWFKDGLPVTSGTNVSLLIDPSSRSSQGVYQMEVVGPGGTNHTREAHLRVVSAQRINTLAIDSSGRVELTFGDADDALMTGAARTNFVIQASTDLRIWTTVSTNGSGVAVAAGKLAFQDGAIAFGPVRFYRVLE